MADPSEEFSPSGVIPTDSMALTMSPPWWTAAMNWSLLKVLP